MFHPGCEIEKLQHKVGGAKTDSEMSEKMHSDDRISLLVKQTSGNFLFKKIYLLQERGRSA